VGSEVTEFGGGNPALAVRGWGSLTRWIWPGLYKNLMELKGTAFSRAAGASAKQIGFSR
jgi:hypothetical protein